MTTFHKFSAFGAGLVAAVMFFWSTTVVCAQAENEGLIHVCVGPDRVLRRVQLKEPCPAGHRSLYLEALGLAGEAEDQNAPEADKPGPKKPGTDNRRLRGLELRLRSLENRPRNKVTAPFEVVDKAGEPIMKVEPGTVWFYEGGKQVATIAMLDDGAFFNAGSDSLRVHIGAAAGLAGVDIDEGDKSRLELGKGEKGNFRLVFLTPDGKQVAGIGETTEGTGAARIGSNDGTLKATIQVDKDGKGLFAVHNSSGIPIASLKEGANGGGLLEITNSGGEPMVHAGVHEEGFGVVKTGPGAFAGFGAPGSFIRGKR